MTGAELTEYHRRLSLRNERRAHVEALMGWGAVPDRSRVRLDDDALAAQYAAAEIRIKDGPIAGFRR